MFFLQKIVETRFLFSTELFFITLFFQAVPSTLICRKRFAQLDGYKLLLRGDEDIRNREEKGVFGGVLTYFCLLVEITLKFRLGMDEK